MHFFFEKIIPTTVVKDRNAYEIVKIDESLHIDGFVITTFTKNNNVTCINVFGEHPNVNSDNNEYCLPEHKKGRPLNDAFLSLINTNIRTYYYDNAYFIPDNKSVQIKKLKSMFVQLNQGE